METGIPRHVRKGSQLPHLGATDKLCSQAANLVTLPAAPDMMDALLAWLLDNLVLTATSNRTTVQWLTSANLSLTTSVTTWTAAIKNLTKKVACCNLAPQGGGSDGGCGGNSARRGPKAIWWNYCWTRGYKVLHTSKTCNVIGRKPGHNEVVLVADTKGGQISTWTAICKATMLIDGEG